MSKSTIKLKVQTNPQPVLEVKPNAQSGAIFTISQPNPEEVQIVGDATFRGDVAMNGALKIEGGLSVSKTIIADGGDLLIVNVEDLLKMTLDEMLTSETESLRKSSKIIYDKVMEKIQSIDEKTPT